MNIQNIAQFKQVVKDNAVFLLIKTTCPYCIRAEEHLRKLNIDFETYAYREDQWYDDVKREYNHRTFPFVFIGGKLIGGCSELLAITDERIKEMYNQARSH